MVPDYRATKAQKMKITTTDNHAQQLFRRWTPTSSFMAEDGKKKTRSIAFSIPEGHRQPQHDDYHNRHHRRSFATPDATLPAVALRCFPPIEIPPYFGKRIVLPPPPPSDTSEAVRRDG